QNYLRSEDIDKIITTFRDRKVEDKYSHLATIDEIKENDYNLNIPRYVDTFEEEKIVDLDEVSKELKALDNDIIETNKTISDFCDELGIEKPF
ncbi:N-6 DNA methylase, partial [archaeon]|nr:N-6 DNA methylase [archaeon]